jgi:hypothetical protein
MLAAGEAFLIPLLLWKATSGEDAGIESGTLLNMAGNLVPYLGWRIWCFRWRPEWFGSVDEAVDTRKTQ